MSETTKSTAINLGAVANISLGQGRCFAVNGELITVFRQRDGKLFASQDRCPHKGGPLSEGVVGGGKVICPLHAHKFDLGSGQGSEAGESIKTYAVSESGGEIILQFGDSRG